MKSKKQLNLELQIDNLEAKLEIGFEFNADHQTLVSRYNELLGEFRQTWGCEYRSKRPEVMRKYYNGEELEFNKWIGYDLDQEGG